MPVTLTIKQVPQRLADGLRERAAANRRSQQQELLLMLEGFIDQAAPAGVSEPTRAVYRTGATMPDKRGRKASARTSATPQPGADMLSLEALWQRARELGAGMPSESSPIVRDDRDTRHR